jgi:hypothetical protein
MAASARWNMGGECKKIASSRLGIVVEEHRKLVMRLR